MTREYITYSISEYFLLGRKDALTYGKEETLEIINSLVDIMNKEDIIKRIVNYLQGYKIATLEILFNRIEKTKYNYETHEFVHLTETGEKKVSFEKGFNSLKEETEKEALTLINKRRH